jgi:hypothetical protein
LQRRDEAMLSVEAPKAFREASDVPGKTWIWVTG